MSREALIETCVNCKIPTSSHGKLRWCLYCDHAADGKQFFTKKQKQQVKVSAGGGHDICLVANGIKYAVIFFSGDSCLAPKYVLQDCDVLFSPPVPAGVMAFVNFFVPKEGQ